METTTSTPLPIAERSRKPWRAIFALAALLYWAALYLYVPTLPVYVQSKAGNLALVGTVLSMYGLWQAFFRLPVGLAADFLGRRKPFIIGGLLVLALGDFLLGKASTVTGLAVGRATTGIAASTWVPLLVLFGGLFPAAEAVRATAFLTTMSSVGRIIATSLTATLNNLGGNTLPFYAAAVLAGVAALIVSLYPERRRPRSESVTMPQAVALLSNPLVMLPAILNIILQYMDFTATFTFISIQAKSLGSDIAGLGLLSTLSMVTVFLANLSVNFLTGRVRLKPVLLAALSLMCVGVGLAAVAPTLNLLIACQLLISVGGGISYPILLGMGIQYVEGNQRTVAMGLHTSLYSIGMFAGPWLSGILAARLGIPLMFGMTAVTSLVLTLVVGSKLKAE